jgi:hypothetical protein
MFTYNLKAYNKTRARTVCGNQKARKETPEEKAQRVKLGRKPRRKVLKPNLKLVVDICGNSNLARLLGISSHRITNWLYTRTYVPRKYTGIMADLTIGLIQARDINKSERRTY